MTEKNKKELERKDRMSLTFLFSLFVFIILLAAVLVSAGIVFLVEFLVGSEATLDTWLVLLLMVVASAIIGTTLVFLLSKFPLNPINELINGMNRLARGDFSARLKFGGILDNNSTFREISESFNKMAEDLGNTETLRVDFANNFSHEFKTPIMSIAGFARLLRQGNVTEEEKEQYLEVIEAESRRLSSMATGILKLTSVENQTILTQKKLLNVSEQIRSSVLVLEEKWAKKNITPVLDFDEYSIMADEGLLKEIWINLLDNAIKYSPADSEITVTVAEEKSYISVAISNTGDLIPEDKLDKIFRKFYQTDESHSSVGSGIGLAIVKRTCELHGGYVEVESCLVDGAPKTTFTVYLPR